MDYEEELLGCNTQVPERNKTMPVSSFLLHGCACFAIFLASLSNAENSLFACKYLGSERRAFISQG